MEHKKKAAGSHGPSILNKLASIAEEGKSKLASLVHKGKMTHEEAGHLGGVAHHKCRGRECDKGHAGSNKTNKNKADKD